MDFGNCLENAVGCTGSAQPGTVALRDGVEATYPGIGNDGIYNCRQTRGGGSWSLHAEGRAWDAHCDASTQLALGNTLAAHLVIYHQKLGIQRVIWNHRIWDAARGWHAYNGVDPHTGHLHIEICWAAAKGTQQLTVSYVKSVLPGYPVKEWDELATRDEVKQALREVLNEAPTSFTVGGLARTLFRGAYYTVGTTLHNVVTDIRAIKDKVAP